MPSTLLIHYRAPGQPLAVGLLDERGGFQQRPESILRLAGEPDAERVVVLFDGGRTSVLAANVPAKGRDQLARALPFALEDQLIDPIDELHFAFDAPASGDGQRVVAIRCDLLAAWLDDLAARGVRPDSAHVDALTLPFADGVLVAAIDDARAWLRAGPTQIWAGASEELPEWIDVLAAERPRPARVDLYGAPPPTLDATRVLAHAEREPRTAFELMARGYARGERGPELLVDRFTPAARGAADRRLWRIAAGIGIVALVATALATALGFAALERRSSALDGAIAELYQRAYPNAPMAPDPRARIEADVGALASGDGAGALALIARVAPALSQSTRWQLRALEYRDGALELSLLGQDLAALDQLRESLAALPGLDAELAQANTDERGTSARIVVREGAGA